MQSWRVTITVRATEGRDVRSEIACDSARPSVLCSHLDRALAAARSVAKMSDGAMVARRCGPLVFRPTYVAASLVAVFCLNVSQSSEVTYPVVSTMQTIR